MLLPFVYLQHGRNPNTVLRYSDHIRQACRLYNCAYVVGVLSNLTLPIDRYETT